MKTYDLYLESGPRHKKTMVHVLELLGCVAVGPTTEAALAATPGAVRAYLRFLRRHGQPVEPEAPFEARVSEHVTEGQWLGNGSPYLVFGPDLEPLSDPEIDVLLQRFAWLREEFADWIETQAEAQLEGVPDGGGRTAKAILLHVLPGPGDYLAAALGSAPGFHALQTAAERGAIALPEALRRAATMTAERVQAATPEERAAVRERNGTIRTLRKALRRCLEHDWEHLAELSRRLGGPRL